MFWIFEVQRNVPPFSEQDLGEGLKLNEWVRMVLQRGALHERINRPDHSQVLQFLDEFGPFRLRVVGNRVAHEGVD